MDQPVTNIDVEVYCQGDCHIFALALHEAFGFPMTFIWDVEPSDEDGQPLEFEALHHAVCRRPDGTFVDASGTVAMEDAMGPEHGDADILNPRPTTPDDVEAAMGWENGLRRPRADELELLIAFIVDNAELYRDGVHDMSAALSPATR